jgi:hypothetical protein
MNQINLLYPTFRNREQCLGAGSVSTAIIAAIAPKSMVSIATYNVLDIHPLLEFWLGKK